MNNQVPTSTKSAYRRFIGEVVAAPGHKTISVAVKTIRMHPKYRKQFSTTKKFAVHDETNEAKVGAVVEFRECRPISKTKRWRLVKIDK